MVGLISHTLRHRIIAVSGVALIGGIAVGVFAVQGSYTPLTGQNNVVPNLVPDVGGLHAGSQGSTSAPKTAAKPAIRLIPSAGAPVKAFGGSPGGATFVPVKGHEGSPLS
jgi:hypothetical protein